MNRTVALLVAIAASTAGSAYALYSVRNEGTWPTSWPKELEPLRKQSRTLVGPLAPQVFYEIPFTKREDFESAWPHLLKIKTQRAPVILLRGPDARLGTTIKAGVRIHCPPGYPGKSTMPETPINSTNVRQRWMYTTFIDLVVDGEIVDLNRVPLPADTPVIDERFKEASKPSAERGGG